MRRNSHTKRRDYGDTSQKLDQPYKFKKGLHIANFSMITPEQMNHVRLIDPVSTRHLPHENEEDAIHYISSLLKAKRNNDQYEQY